MTIGYFQFTTIGYFPLLGTTYQTTRAIFGPISDGRFNLYSPLSKRRLVAPACGIGAHLGEPRRILSYLHYPRKRVPEYRRRDKTRLKCFRRITARLS